MPPIATRQYIAQTRFLFHCHCKIKIPVHFGEQVLDSCFRIMEDIDRRYNSHQPGSYFDRLNSSAGQWVETDAVTVSLLQKLHSVSEATVGAYDVTSMPLIRAWGFYDRSHSGKLPAENRINRALGNVDYRKIAINGYAVKIDEGQELITGSFIKAFAVDEVVKELRKHGVTDAIINAGGSTIYALNDEEHPDWKINIPHPAQKDEFKEQVRLSNGCFSLSGKVNNYIKIKGKRYGHILHAKTGFPSDTLQVGVFSRDAFWGDVLSTALFAVQADHFEQSLTALKRIVSFDFFIIRADEL